MRVPTGTARGRDTEPWPDRPGAAKAWESGAFCLYYLVSAFAYWFLFAAVLAWELTWNFLQLQAILLAIALPFQFLLWYKSGARYRYLSPARISVVGVAAALIPALVITVLTFGLALVLLVFMLPPAIPYTMLLVWIFVLLRARLTGLP